jgi:hypothetical protein
MRQFMFAIQNTSDGEAERVSSVANLQQPRSTRQSTLSLYKHGITTTIDTIRSLCKSKASCVETPVLRTLSSTAFMLEAY